MKAVVSGLVAVCVAALAGLLAGGHGLDAHFSAVALALGALAGAGAWASLKGLPAGKPFRGWAAWAMGIAFALFAARAFCWLIFNNDENISFLSPNNLGDLSLHLTYINYFANGAPLWPANPIFSSAALHYPFGVDLFNALLVSTGLDLQRGLVWTGLLAALATAIALWRWCGAFALAAFLFNGGLAVLLSLPHPDISAAQEHLDWKSIPLALFVTQRGLLYAIPAGLALLWSWRERFFRASRGLPFWIEALLYATMPFFHLHTFLFLSAMLGAWMFVPAAAGRPAPRKEIFKLVATALLPATWLVFKVTGFGQSGGAIHLSAGWIGKDLSLLDATMQNFGVLPFLLLGTLGWLWLRRQEPEMLEHAAFMLPALAVFAIACYVIFAPWEWDNTKLMIWCYFAILPALDALLEKQGSAALRALACVALFASGALTLAAGLSARNQGYALADRTELDSLRPQLRRIPVTATFACLPTYNHPLLVLGHKAVAGYEGHLFSHGIAYRPNFDALERLLRAEPGWAARARQLGADYLFWGPREREKYGTGNGDPWRDRLPVAAAGSWGVIYDLRGAVESEIE